MCIFLPNYKIPPKPKKKEEEERRKEFETTPYTLHLEPIYNILKILKCKFLTHVTYYTTPYNLCNLFHTFVVSSLP